MTNTAILILLVLTMANGTILYKNIQISHSAEALKEELMSFNRTANENAVAVASSQVNSAPVVKAKATVHQVSKDDFSLANNNQTDLVYGNSSARITLVTYSDIECPFCRKMHPEIKAIVDRSKGVINWHFKHFPLKQHNPAAALGAQAVECVAEHYDNQSAWYALDLLINTTQGNGKGINDYKAFFRSIGLNGQLLTSCMNLPKHQITVNREYAEGQSIGIRGTPAVVIKDNQTGNNRLFKQYTGAEDLLRKIHGLMNS